MILKDALEVLMTSIREKQELERKKRQFIDITKQQLNYLIIEDIAKAVSRQAPGYYCQVKLANGTVIEMGVRERAAGHRDGEAF